MLPIQAEAFAAQTFLCKRCKNSFQARVATWVDATRTPSVNRQLQEGDFNTIVCPDCGHRQFSGSFFFYEDFQEGLLLAVFPSIPDDHQALEEEIRMKYGYYPIVDIFYDMTQLWFLIYLQEHYKKNGNLRSAAMLGTGEERLQKFLAFVKKDPLMLTLRQTLKETFSGSKSNDDLHNVLWRALTKIEGFSPRHREIAPAGPQPAK